MRKEDKSTIISTIAETVKEYDFFYLTDVSTLNAAKTSELRAECYKSDIKLMVVKNTLLQMAQQGGRNTEKDLFGANGGYHTILSNKTWQKPCPVCGGEIIRQTYLGGNIYFCPHCQPPA